MTSKPRIIECPHCNEQLAIEREAQGIPLIDVELRDLIEKVGARHWDVDWNSPHLILRSDGSGRLMAKGFDPYAAEFIVAAARFVARLASESSRDHAAHPAETHQEQQQRLRREEEDRL